MKRVYAIIVSGLACGFANAQVGPEPWDWNPALSPDGSLIVFQSERDGDDDLYIWDRENRTLRLLLDTPGQERFPRWSPDGEWIVFGASDREGLHWDIYRIRPDGSELSAVRRTNRSEVLPAFSPDGEWVAFSGPTESDTMASHIQIMRNDGTDHRVLTERPEFYDSVDYAFWPEWSPDGSEIAFVAGSGSDDTADIWIIDVVTRDVRPLIITEQVKESGPSWSPDGQSIAVSYGIGRYQFYNLAIISADGSGYQPLDAISEYHASPRWDPYGGGLIYHQMIDSGAILSRYSFEERSVDHFGIPGGWEETFRSRQPQLGLQIEPPNNPIATIEPVRPDDAE